MINDIISDHRERMLNLKKYYPFFKLIDVSFSQFKEGKYQILDMGYIVMGILRFFIEENNFKEKDVTYPEYLEFVSEMLSRDFGLVLSEPEYKEIADYIFDKIKNEGKPFDFEYFDPVDRKKRISRMKIIESVIRNHTVWYSISADAIEFYLDTKEIRDESKISVQQLLLEKMIRAKNFRGGTEVVERINEEVSRLQLKKAEIMTMLGTDVFAGIEAYEDFVSVGMQWFEEEEKLFKKNRELIEAALSRMEQCNDASESYYRTMNEIYALENQLKVAMNRHGELLRACTDMQKMTDDAVKKAKLGRLRSHTDFTGMLQSMIATDRAELLTTVLGPLLKPKIRKTFPVIMIDDALTVKPAKYEETEFVSHGKPETLVFEDEREDERIRSNYIFIMKNLLQCMEQKREFTLGQFNDLMSRTYSPELLKNADYYSFFVNLCQRERYTFGEGEAQKESFLDDLINEGLQESPKVSFTIEMQGENELMPDESCEMSDVIFHVV